MRNLLSRLLPTLVVSACAAGPASADYLTGEAIREFIGGKRVYLATGFGVEFPMHYQDDGSVTGDGSGTGLGRYFAPKETGQWWVAGDRMCQQFPTWYDGKRLCFQIRRTGDNTLDWQREDGRSGTARIAG